MGMSFSTIQIKNKQKAAPKQFQKVFCEYMEKNGFIPTDDKDAELSYCLAFSDKSDWVTLCSADDDAAAVREDAPKLAKMLHTYCVVTSIWDSDTMELNLFGALTDERDYVLAGRPPWGDDETPDLPFGGKGMQKQWEPLLVNDATWEQLKEIWNADYIFEEEAFSIMAPLLGMDSNNIMMDYRICEEVLPDSPNIVTLHFKHARQTVSLFLKEGPTVLKMGTAGYPVGEENSLFNFYNTGGVGTGVCAFFVGDCIEKDVEICEVKISRAKDPKNIRNAKYPDDYEFFTTNLEKKEYSAGSFGYFAYANDYTFSDGINSEHPSMSGNKMYSTKSIDLIFAHSSVVDYKIEVLSGLQHELRIGVAPMNNWLDGQVSVTVQAFKSREIYTFISVTNTPDTPKPVREKKIKELTDHELLADIAENDSDSAIRQIAADRLAELLE